MGKKLFVGNLAFEVTDTALKEMFAGAGTCVSASVVMDRLTGRSRGFGFVEMSTAEEAQRAIAELNGRELQGRSISVSEARERSERPAGRPFSAPREFTDRQPPGGETRFRKSGGSRRGLRAKRRSL